MDKIVIIGANDFQNPLILKVKEMDYETHVFAWKTGDSGEKNADYFYDISIIEKEKILEKCESIRPVAIVSIASDLAVVTVNYLADKLGLIANSIDSSLICTNKYEMRHAFEVAGIYTPKYTFWCVNNKLNVDDFHFPIIIKPTDRSGSRGITKVNVPNDDIKFALDNAIKNSFEKKAIIEEYIEGEEYSCECISYKGKHTCLAITKKYTTGPPSFIETAHIQPAELSENIEKKIILNVFKALDSLKIMNGASHSEFKLNLNGDICIIEIGARMGGDCIGSDLVKISTGYDYLKMVVDVALNKEPDFNRIDNPKIAFVKFICTLKDLENLNIIKEKYVELIYYISLISEFDHEVVDSSSRYGFYILKINNNYELKKIKNIVGVV